MAKRNLKASLVGIQYQKPPFVVHNLIKLHPISIKRDRQNQHDENAVEVLLMSHRIGYLDKDSALAISSLLDRGYSYQITTNSFSSSSKSIGLSIEFSIPEESYVSTPKADDSAGIYKISIEDDEYVYIGQSNDIKKRWSTHWNDLQFNIHGNKNLQALWNGKGSVVFKTSVIETVPSNLASGLERQRWLAEREQYWIKFYRDKAICVNITDGEVIATNKAVKEYEVEQRKIIKEHDEPIKARKKEIKLLIEKLDIDLEIQRRKLGEIRAEVGELDSYIRKNSGLRGFFTGSVPKSLVDLKRPKLENLMNTLKAQETVVSDLNSKKINLRNESKKLKTYKQLENRGNQVLVRYGINPYINKPKIK
jgi:hypothetical protein